MEQRASSIAATERRKRTGAKIWTLPALCFSGVAFLLLAYLCQSAQVVRAQYRILAVKQGMKSLQAERSELELEVQELTSLERVEAVALKDLGMVVPEERRVIEVVWTLPEPAIKSKKPVSVAAR